MLKQESRTLSLNRLVRSTKNQLRIFHAVINPSDHPKNTSDSRKKLLVGIWFVGGAPVHTKMEKKPPYRKEIVGVYRDKPHTCDYNRKSNSKHISLIVLP